MRLIHTRDEFRAFAAEQGVRSDWHEPDEQELTARVEGVSFDNAGFWGREVDLRIQELHVVFSRTEFDDELSEHVPVEDLAAVNLATLCGWAAER